MSSSSELTAFLKDPKPVAGAFFERRHVAIWLVLASELLTAFQMREGVAALIVLAINALLLGLAITWFKRSQKAIWLAAASEILVATQMTPDRATVVVLLINAVLLAAAVFVARVVASVKSA